MQIFLLYLFLFIFGCLSGWVIELLFRRFVSAKKWVNPGFMRGPWLPLYGFGVILMFSMCYLASETIGKIYPLFNPLGNLFNNTVKSQATIYDIIPIASMWAGMVLLEFLAGLIFIRGLKVKLWDYTNMRGNIMGVICPVFSLIWLGVAILYYYLINPFMYSLASRVYAYMFGGEGSAIHFGFIFVLGIGYGLMIYDFVASIGIFKAVSKFARDLQIIDRYEEVKAKFNSVVKDSKQKVYDALPKAVKDGLSGLKNMTKEDSAISKKISEMIYIDPEYEKTKKSNYDENGRPIKVDDNKK